jgi:hypothetical protein
MFLAAELVLPHSGEWMPAVSRVPVYRFAAVQ